MGSPCPDTSWPSSIINSFDRSFNIRTEEGNSTDTLDFSTDTLDFLKDRNSSVCSSGNIPLPPRQPSKVRPKMETHRGITDSCCVPKETKDTWDKLFKQGYGADVHIIAGDGSIIAAHYSFLSIASPVLGNFLQQSKVMNGIRCIKISGVPCDALRTFISFLYSSCYEEEEMKKFVLHLLVLSHSYVVPSLKRVCTQLLERGWLTKENVVDVLQLAMKCDAPRLTLICMHMVVRDFKCISSTEGWKIMRRANPALEQQILELLVEADSRKQERSKKLEEKMVYLQLHEAMEALLHICRDGCKTIRLRDKALKGNQVACSFPACKGLEILIRHFSSCNTRVPGGCVHCKRMWQLLELHSRMCNEPDYCNVPLCRHFKEKMQRDSKREQVKWKLLVNKAKRTHGTGLEAYRMTMPDTCASGSPPQPTILASAAEAR
ncbi:BTB/POZ and TAZ domain-containing protein 3 [Forsythia ovata]|uniref:BTB/POZ and TAZ domain-containing protein 3 n=1 Tax=Forsythia ovata TaxID=205694 RepID=A0ABD1RGY4_9LAMI